MEISDHGAPCNYSKTGTCEIISIIQDSQSAEKQPQQICRETHRSTEGFLDERYPQLSIGTFFEFMRTAYQVNDSFEGLAAMLTKNSEINWNKLAKIDLNLQIYKEQKKEDNNCRFKDFAQVYKSPEETTESTLATPYTVPVTASNVKNVNIDENTSRNENVQSAKEVVTLMTRVKKKEKLTNCLSKSCSSSKSEPCLCSIPETEETEHILKKLLKRNVSDILHEGLLDSILPYMLPKGLLCQPIIKRSIINIDVKKNSSTSNNNETGAASNNIVPPTTTKDRDKSKDTTKRADMNEIEIHVCDEGKSVRKDFRCPQKLLIQKMRYFADVTAGQKLEEIDISVHCDIVIFDWLMRWVKKDMIDKSEWPVLEAANVIPIMVSASFLQMEPLLENCLQFCHDNMCDVLKSSAVLTCLNDNLLTRLAELFTNEDVENLKDKKDKIQSRLFCKLITSLMDINPDNKRGHYSSLATLFKCGKCGKHVIQSVSDSIPCISSGMRIDGKGIIHSKHIRDSTWSLNEYITYLRSELRSWRKVYWRLWADCHFLFCQRCNMYFPIHQIDWCRYHPDRPQYFVNEQHKPMLFPLGRYPCCSQRAYRFQVLPNVQGCKYREHLPDIKTEKDVNVFNLSALYRELVSADPPRLYFPEKITRLITHDTGIRSGRLACKETMWWSGIQLAPTRPKFGLLGKIWGGSSLRDSIAVRLTDSKKSPRKIRMTTSTTDSFCGATTDSDNCNNDHIHFNKDHGDNSNDNNNNNNKNGDEHNSGDRYNYNDHDDDDDDVNDDINYNDYNSGNYDDDDGNDGEEDDDDDNDDDDEVDDNDDKSTNRNGSIHRNSTGTSCDENSIDEESHNDDESNNVHPSSKIADNRTKRKSRVSSRPYTRESGRCWSNNLIVRYNQDNQRDFEERIAAQMSSLLIKRTSIGCSVHLAKQYDKARTHNWKNNYMSHHSTPLGGTYVKLEAEFRDQWAQSYKCKYSATVKNPMRSKGNKLH